VIDFRYHLVSIVAVFLALAIGIVLGSTELQGNTITALQGISNKQYSELIAADARNAALQAQAKDEDQFLQSAKPRLLAGLLPGDRLVIVTEPGAQGPVVDDIKQAAALAGATVTGQVALQPKFNDVSAPNQATLGSINSSVSAADGITLSAGAGSQTDSQQQAAQLIAYAILATKTSSQAGLTSTAEQALLNEYAQAGYLTVSPGAPAPPATLAVIVTPQTAPADGANDPANQVLVAVAQEFASASAATLVAGGTIAPAQYGGSAMSVLRSSSVSGQVSSVDNADTALGQIVVIQALAAQLANGKPNSYGISGDASAVSPVPAPTPSATATATATPTSTPHPTATGTGKGGKQAVKKK
jgi:Copper transport outer membrane protein, MctB